MLRTITCEDCGAWQGLAGGAWQIVAGVARQGEVREVVTRDTDDVVLVRESIMAKAKATPVTLAAIDRKWIEVTIIGTSPLVQHAWAEKAKEMMRAKHGGKKAKTRDVRDPEAEGREAAYYTADGKYGIAVSALKSSIIGAAHKDTGVDKTLVRKSVFILCDDPGGVLPMDCDEPTIQEDPVRVGQGSADLRYRPYFYRWSLTFTVEIDATLMEVETLVKLIDRAGFGVGIGEMRPEKGKEHGRFRVDVTKPVTETGQGKKKGAK